MQTHKKETEAKCLHSAAQLCKLLRSCAKLCKVVNSYNFFRALQDSAELCKILQSCAKLCKVVTNYEKLCKLLQSCIKLWKILQNFAQFYSAVKNYAVYSILRCNNAISLSMIYCMMYSSIQCILYIVSTDGRIGKAVYK